ncbi:hypothetical protein ANCCAN_05602 [Ancylostoma caninum]|uniref:Uncharacterized protein n=1 Tax=Ancylostoma caninum TaxID=29170 RepID=A0A368GVB5_ANCCA|nr:hypothetical protein ANCCAN_05602 [Ancylostoma caninum]
MKCYRIKGCHGNYGCCRCYDKGDTYRRRHVWPKTDTTTPRTPSSVTRDINLRINGVYGKSIFSEICPMSDVVVDFLHNGPEGPIKRIIEETFGISGKSTASWPIRLRQADVELVDRLLKTTAMNSNARGAPRALSDIRNMNGTQFMELDVWICERLAWILQTLSGIFDKLFGNEFATIKKHWLFDHHAEDLLQNGAPQELSSSSFEKDYRLHKKAVAVGNTRAVEHASWTKHLLVSSTLHELCRRGESQNNKVKLSQLCLSGTASLESAEFHRLNDVVYNMSNNYRVNRMALSASDLSLFDQLRNDGFSTFLTRVIYKGLMFGTSVAVEGKHTQNHVISFYHNGIVRVGSVVIFAVGEDAIFMAVRCYDHASPFDRLKRWLRRNNQKELCEIYDFIDSYNSFWFLLPDDVNDNSSVFITEANNIRGPGLTFNVASSKSPLSKMFFDEMLSDQLSAAEELRAFTGYSSFSTPTEETRDASGGPPVYEDLSHATVKPRANVEPQPVDAMSESAPSPLSTSESVWSISKERPKRARGTSPRKRDQPQRSAKEWKNVLTGRPIVTRKLPPPSTDASGSQDVAGPSSRPSSSAPLSHHYGARLVQQYNEKPFTTDGLVASVLRIKPQWAFSCSVPVLIQILVLDF